MDRIPWSYPGYTGESETHRPGAAKDLVFSDIISRHEAETRRLLRFLGADSSDGAIHRCTEKTGFERGSAGRKPGQEDPASRFRKGIAGDWKNVFTTEDIRAFEEIAKDALDRFRYERSR